MAEGLRERTISEMAQVFKGVIIFGEDGMSVPIKGSAPHGCPDAG